jgi:hypothetical protein
MSLSIETLENLVRVDQHNHQAKVDAGLAQPRIELVETLMHRLAEKALHVPNFPNYVDHPGPCACMGNERPTDPGCYCAMRSMLYARRFEVALFLARNPDFAPVEYVPPNAVFIKAGQATMENMKALRAAYDLTIPEAKEILTNGGQFTPKKDWWSLEGVLDKLKSVGIQAELGVVDLIFIEIPTTNYEDTYRFTDWLRQNAGRQGNSGIDLANGRGNWMVVSVMSQKGNSVEIHLNDVSIADAFRSYFGIEKKAI